MSLNVASAVQSAGCVHHRRVDGDCADAHISDCLSIRPRSLIVSTGQLVEGCAPQLGALLLAEN